MNQKKSLTIKGEGGQEIDLQIEKQYLENGRERNPVICTVIENASDYKYFGRKDRIIVHHNFFDKLEDNPFYIAYNREAGTGIFSIPAGKNIFCKLNDDGSVEPLCHNVLVERLKNPIKSTLIIPEMVKQEFNDRVKVVACSPEITELKAGQTVIIHVMADYEICYTWDKKDYSVIKVFGGDKEFDGDIIGIID